MVGNNAGKTKDKLRASDIADIPFHYVAAV